MRCDLVGTSAPALAFVGSVGLAAVQQPPPNASPPADVVFVNGAWAVPGAPANTDTVPAKFSAKNAADDKLITIACGERKTIFDLQAFGCAGAWAPD